MRRCRKPTGEFKRCGGGRRRRGMRGLGTHPGCTCTRRKTVTIKKGKMRGRRVKRCTHFRCGK